MAGMMVMMSVVHGSGPVFLLLVMAVVSSVAVKQVHQGAEQ
jgi:hypothetical protein